MVNFVTACHKNRSKSQENFTLQLQECCNVPHLSITLRDSCKFEAGQRNIFDLYYSRHWREHVEIIYPPTECFNISLSIVNHSKNKNYFSFVLWSLSSSVNIVTRTYFEKNKHQNLFPILIVGTLPAGIISMGRAVDHSLPSSATVMNLWRLNSTATYAFVPWTETAVHATVITHCSIFTVNYFSRSGTHP